jgi:hypothetical protein
MQANEVAEFKQQPLAVVNDLAVSGVTLSKFLASMSRCRETLRRYKRPYRMLAKRFLRLRSLRLRTFRSEKASRGSSARKPRGNQTQRLSRRRPQGTRAHE